MNFAATMAFDDVNSSDYEESIMSKLARCFDPLKTKKTLTTSAELGYEINEISSSVDISSFIDEANQCAAVEIMKMSLIEKLLDELFEVFNDCSEKDWDGYEAEGVSIKAYFEASILLNLVPTYFPAPEITAEPDGGIGLEWYKEKGHTFVISVDGNKIITYAGLFGENSVTHGTEPFDNKIPSIIIEHLNSLFPELNE